MAGGGWQRMRKMVKWQTQQSQANSLVRLLSIPGVILPPSGHKRNDTPCQSPPTSHPQTAFTQSKQAHAASSIRARLWFEFIVWHYKPDFVEFIDFPGEATWQSAQTQSQRRNVVVPKQHWLDFIFLYTSIFSSVWKCVVCVFFLFFYHRFVSAKQSFCYFSLQKCDFCPEIKADCLKGNTYLQVSPCFNVLWQLRGTVIRSVLCRKTQTPQILLGIVRPQSNTD